MAIWLLLNKLHGYYYAYIYITITGKLYPIIIHDLSHLQGSTCWCLLVKSTVTWSSLWKIMDLKSLGMMNFPTVSGKSFFHSPSKAPSSISLSLSKQIQKSQPSESQNISNHQPVTLYLSRVCFRGRCVDFTSPWGKWPGARGPMGPWRRCGDAVMMFMDLKTDRFYSMELTLFD